MADEMNSGIPSEQPLQTQSPESTQTQQSAPAVDTPTAYEIEGLGSVTAKDIAEWQKGYMRQSDYTKKTTELSATRKETEKAIEVYNYLKSNPHVAQQLSEGNVDALQNTPIAKSFSGDNKYQELEIKLASIEIDNAINSLKAKYPNFNEIEVLTEADRLGLTDLEFVHNALEGRKAPQMRQDLEKQIRAQITEQIKKNGLSTSTLITETDSSTKESSHGLTDVEIRIASNMGMTPEAYARGKTRVK